jgi:hypothetical protein
MTGVNGGQCILLIKGSYRTVLKTGSMTIFSDCGMGRGEICMAMMMQILTWVWTEHWGCITNGTLFSTQYTHFHQSPKSPCWKLCTLYGTRCHLGHSGYAICDGVMTIYVVLLDAIPQLIAAESSIFIPISACDNPSSLGILWSERKWNNLHPPLYTLTMSSSF